MSNTYQGHYWRCATANLPNALAEANRLLLPTGAILFAGVASGNATNLVLTVQAVSLDDALAQFRAHASTMDSVPAVVPLHESIGEVHAPTT